MRTFIQGDEEMTCACNYHTDPIVLDYENEVMYCSICGTKALMPSYFDWMTAEELLTFYTDPDKKVYDFGTGLNLHATLDVMNFVAPKLQEVLK